MTELVELICLHKGQGPPSTLRSYPLAAPAVESAHRNLYEWIDAHPEVADGVEIGQLPEVGEIARGATDSLSVQGRGHFFDDAGRRVERLGEFRQHRGSLTGGHQLRCTECGTSVRVTHEALMILLRHVIGHPIDCTTCRWTQHLHTDELKSLLKHFAAAPNRNLLVLSGIRGMLKEFD